MRGYGLREKDPRPSLRGLVQSIVVVVNLRVAFKPAQLAFVFLDVAYPSRNTIWRDLDDRSQQTVLAQEAMRDGVRVRRRFPDMGDAYSRQS